MIFENSKSLKRALLGSVSATALIAAYTAAPKSVSAATVEVSNGQTITSNTGSIADGLTETTTGATTITVDSSAGAVTFGAAGTVSVTVNSGETVTGSQLTINITTTGTAAGVTFADNIVTTGAKDTLTINSITDNLTFGGSAVAGGGAITITMGSTTANLARTITILNAANEVQTIAATIDAVDATDTVLLNILSTQSNANAQTLSGAIGGTVGLDAITVSTTTQATTATFSSTVNTGTFSVAGNSSNNKAASATITGNFTASGAVAITGVNSGAATLILGGETISVTAGVTVTTSTGVGTLIIEGAQNQTVTGAIAGVGNPILRINGDAAGNTVAFTSNVGVGGAMGTIAIGADSEPISAVFQGNVSSGIITLGNTGAKLAQMVIRTASNGTNLSVAGTVNAVNAGATTSIVVVDSDSATLDTVTFANTVGNAAVAIDSINIGSATSAGNAIFTGAIGGGAAVTAINVTGGDVVGETSSIKTNASATFTAMTLDENTAQVTATFDGGTVTITGDVQGGAAGEGNVIINATAATFASNGGIGNTTSVRSIVVASVDTQNTATVFNGSINTTSITIGGGTNADTHVFTFNDNDNNAESIIGTIDAGAANDTVTLNILDAANGAAPTAITFTSNIGATGGVDTLAIGSATQAGSAVFNGTVNAGAITMIAGNAATETALATFNGAVNATTISVKGGNTGNITQDATATFTDNVTAATSITVDDDTGQAEIKFSGSAQTITGAVNAQIANEGTVTIDGTGVTLNSSIGNTAKPGLLLFTSTAKVTFSKALQMDANTFTNHGQLAFNGTVSINDSGSSVQLGANAGTSKIVINVPNSSFASDGTNGMVIKANAANIAVAAAANTIAVTPHAGFTSGSLVLVKGGGNNMAMTSGHFSITNTAIAQFVFTKSGNDIVINATTKSAAATAAEIGVSAQEGAALSSAVAATTSDATVTAAFNTALSAGGAAAQRAAKQSQPDVGALGAATSASSGAGAASFSAVGARLASLRENRTVAYASGDASLGFAAGSGPLSEAVWLKPLVSHATQELRSGIEGFDSTTRGMAFGFDTEVDEGTRAGIYGSFTLTDVEGDGVQDANTNVTQQSVGVYGDYTTDNFYVEGMVGYARNEVETDRLIDFGGLAAIRAKGEFTSTQYQARVGIGAPLDAGGWYVTPNASLSHTQVNGQNFVETNAGVLNLSVSSGDVKATIGQLGLKIHTNVKQSGGGTLTPEIRGSYMRDFASEEAVTTSNFVQAGGTAFTSTGADVAENSYTGGIGLSYTEGNMSLGVTYDYVGKANFQGHNGSVTARWKF